MGTYNLNESEIADIFEELEFESHCEGDFYEETFILAAIEYIRRLRKQGAYIYSNKIKAIKEFTKELQG